MVATTFGLRGGADLGRSRRDRAQRLRRTGRIRMLGRIKHVALTRRHAGRRRTSRRRSSRRTRLRRLTRRSLPAQFLEAVLVVLLHAPQLTFELLIAVLQLLDCSGELPDLIFKVVETHDEIAGRGLRRAILADRRNRPLVAGAKQAIKERAVRLLRPGGTRHCQKHSGQRRCPGRAKWETCHEPMMFRVDFASS